MEIIFIYKDSNDKKHLIRENYSEGFAVLDEIHGEDQIRDSNRKKRDIPFTDNYLKQVKKKARYINVNNHIQ